MAYLCIGKYAKIPYYVEELFLNIYSAEELCYYLYENAYLLDEEVMREKLCDFVENELGLVELGRKLAGLIRAGASLCAFVSTILEDCFYCSREELKKIESSLRTNCELGIVEKRKARGDYLLGVNKYVLAIEEYNLAFNTVDKEYEPDFFARIYNNLAVAYSKLFLFEMAAKYFAKSYQIFPENDTYISFLAAKRLGALVNEDLKVAENQEFHTEMTKAFEEQMDIVLKEENPSADYKDYINAINAKQEGKIPEYYGILNRLIIKWKHEYRKSTSIE